MNNYPKDNGNNPYQNYNQQQPNYPPYNPSYDTNNAFDCGPEGKSRGVAALLAIIFGGLGVQYFYVNKIGGGFLTILLSLVTCGAWSVVMVVQGIIMLCSMTNEEFRQKFVLSNNILPLF